MNKTFLRSGRLENYLPMGENGQAVYISALQLRETLRLQKKNNIADCLAIPQPNETGERIDWYSPVDGSVISWTTASDDEKENAFQRLSQNQSELIQFSNNKKNSENKEYQLFGALLEKTIQFPDDDHIYIVGGQPVITFWGFVNANKQSRTDPVACLKRPVSAIPSPVINNEIPEPVPVVKKTWWRFLFWLLPLLLLLLAAAFFLRGCSDKIITPGITTGTQPSADPVIPATIASTDVPTVPVRTGVNRLPVTQVTTGRVPVPGIVTDPVATGTIPAIDPAASLSGNTVTDADSADSNATADPGLKANTPPDIDPVTAPTDNTGGVDDPSTANIPDAANTPDAANQQAPDNTVLPPDVSIPASNNSANPPISIPQDAIQSGSVKFLNGQWKAGAGIQDQKTGKPLSLQYTVNDGKGEVIMTRSDGATCRAPVSATMKSGTLHIGNKSPAGCSDGSAYRMPEITCQPGAKNIAECQGEYNKNQKFPISMKRESN